MAKITGVGAAIAGSAKIGPPGPPHSYFGAARALIPGAKVLATASPCPSHALCLVVGFALEGLLKAYLSRNGPDKTLKNSKIQHDLVGLWEKAFCQGLPISKIPPSWVSGLNELHSGPNYHLRYPDKVHGIVMPPTEPMTTDLAALLEVVRKQLNL